MSRRTFFKLVQWSGIIVFGATVFVTLLFVEGYQYDPVTQHLVKKGVVYFEGGLPSDIVVYVNGKEQKLLREGELHLVPGTYFLELHYPGSVPWKRQIIVPDDTVLQFLPLRFFDEKKPFVKTLTEVASMRYSSFSPEGVLFHHPRLHYAKYFALKPDIFKNQLAFSMHEITITASFQELMKGENETWFYRKNDGTLVFSREGKQTETIVEGEKFLSLRAVGRRIFGLNQKGQLLDISDPKKPRLFFNLPVEVSSLKNVASEGSFFLFQFGAPDTAGLVTVTDSEGAIIFQEKGVTASTLEEAAVSYIKEGQMITYEFGARTAKAKKTVATPVVWFSNIGNTFHALFLTDKKELLYCDRDFENCNSIGILDSLFIEASRDRRLFLTVMDNQIVLLNFAEEQSIPKLLQDLFS